MIAQTTQTEISGVENLKVVYERRKWLCFTWYVKIKSTSIGNDLFIQTNEVVERIILNNKEIWKKN